MKTKLTKALETPPVETSIGGVLFHRFCIGLIFGAMLLAAWCLVLSHPRPGLE